VVGMGKSGGGMRRCVKLKLELEEPYLFFIYRVSFDLIFIYEN
jgi:hypothetical protein